MNIQKIKSIIFPPKSNDLSKKQIFKDVINIAWPALVELVLVQLCTIIDSMMVGKLGTSELASVGYCTQPKFLMLCTFIALNSGATAVIARFKGMDDKESANNALRQILIMSFILSFIISIVGFFTSRQMILFMGAETEYTIQNATYYMKIQMLGFIPNALCLSITAALRGIGKTKSSMYYNLIANFINVIFNYLLIYGNFGFPMLGVSGASIATIIGQTIAFIISVIVITRKDGYLKLEFKKIFKIDFSMIKRILKIGFPSMLEQFALRFGLIIYTITVTSLGEVLYATHQIGLNIMGLSFMNGQAFGIAATSLIGQSLGKKRPDHGRAYTYMCRKIGMYISIVLGIIFIVFAAPIFHLFIDDPVVIANGVDIMFIIAINQPFQASQLIISGGLRGAGATKVVAISTLIGVMVIRPIMSYFAVNALGLGLIGAWAAIIIDQIVRLIIVYIQFGLGRWENIKI